MDRIKQLSKEEIQKIAAGEVIERPANAIKELIENALDAGATHISIYIQDAGKALIRIIDNGCGMSSADAQLCFSHHATSKIASVHDLMKINTFGFRGEALSSIASVSKIQLLTREHDADFGTKVTIEQGNIIEQEKISCPAGTEIIVQDLFYNVPARKKFLKTKETEWRHILGMFQAFCLSHVQVHFRLYNENDLVFNCPPVQLIKDRVLQLWDAKLAQHLLPMQINDADKNIQISGLISSHQFFRYDRGCFFFFINARWVRAPQLAKALLKGYLNVLPADRFPAFFLNIRVDLEQVDINIHPRKEEVQLFNGRALEQLLSSSIKKNLEEHLSSYVGRSIHFEQEKKQSFFSNSFSNQSVEMIELKKSILPGAFFVAPEPAFDQTKISAPLNSNSATIDESFDEYTILAQLHKTYILLEKNDGLFLVDQHAAHERVLYEQFASRFEQSACVALLFPQIITLPQAEYEAIFSHLELFKELALELEPFGQWQYVLNATPVHVKDIAFAEIIAKGAAIILENNSLNKIDLAKLVQHDLRAQMACKAAVKAGDELTMIQMERLLVDLNKVANRFTCPHGRPTGWLLGRDEIEKKFKRRL